MARDTIPVRAVVGKPESEIRCPGCGGYVRSTREALVCVQCQVKLVYLPIGKVPSQPPPSQ